MQLEFGYGADYDTFETFFGHLASGYIVRLNGTDMKVYVTRPGDLDAWAYVPKDKFKADTVGLYGFEYDNDLHEADLCRPYGAAWDEIVEVLIY